MCCSGEFGMLVLIWEFRLVIEVVMMRVILLFRVMGLFVLVSVVFSSGRVSL